MAAVYRQGQNGWYVHRFDPKRDYSAWLETDEWQRIRQEAIERADNCCADCGATRRLQVHHLHYRNIGTEQPEDLVVLCESCHIGRHMSESPPISS